MFLRIIALIIFLYESGLTYLTRNCFFEPVQSGKDWVDSCLNEISFAFRWNKPAIISSHRLNYIGALYKENRENGLTKLGSLLKQIMKNFLHFFYKMSNKFINITISIDRRTNIFKFY